MHGLLTLADTVPASTFTTSSAPDMYFRVPAGTITAIDCDTCSSSTIAYPETIANVRRDDITFSVVLQPGWFLNRQP